MSQFWTCGPFKKAHDRVEKMSYRVEQMKVFMDILEEDKTNQEILENGTTDEKLIARLAQLEIDRKIATLLGVPYDGSEETNDEILRTVLLEHVRKGTED